MKTVVVVDDSGTARMFMRRCLEIAGYQGAEFIEAGNGQEALEVLKARGAVDLVVTDLNMPSMDGTEFLRRVMEDPQLNKVPVVVVTSAKNRAKELELYKLGAYGVLAKPISPAMLAETLKPLNPAGATGGEPGGGVSESGSAGGNP